LGLGFGQGFGWFSVWASADFGFWLVWGLVVWIWVWVWRLAGLGFDWFRLGFGFRVWRGFAVELLGLMNENSVRAASE